MVTRAEIERWEIERPDIFAYVQKNEVWFSPDGEGRLGRCPWLVGESAPYHCGIYADRPEDCRSYPTNIDDMERDACEMLEPRDLRDRSAALIRLRELT